MSEFDVDLFVIGGGSGGVRAARISAGYGARVMMAEEYRVGGTCVIRGCVPKKLMVMASRFADDFADAPGFGWDVGTPRFDWSTLMGQKNREIDRLEGIYRANAAKAGVEVVDERATIAGPHQVRLERSGRIVRARHVLVAVGARPLFDPHIPGGELGITSNEVFALERQPERILIVGGGYIGVEFAGVFRGLGSQVTLLFRGDKPLRGFDEEIRDLLAEAYARRGIDIASGTTLERLERLPGGALRATLRSGRVLEVDQVLVATGRRPNTEGLGLETVGIAVDEVGAIPVDSYSRTVAPFVYAVGDVTNRANLTPVAIREGHAFADTVFGGKDTLVEHDLIATAVFSTPEIGVVGMSEAAARALHGDDVVIFKSAFRPMRATLSGRDERTFMKLVVHGGTDKVLGLHVLGPDAGEMIQLAGVAMGMGATKADFDRTVAVHPTAAEELVTMRTPFVVKKAVAVG
jgi:glutathione reductase (NADPH)